VSAAKELNELWAKRWKEFEVMRFSEKQKEAFKFLKNVTKYNAMKANGGLCHAVLNEKGEIITNKDHVDEIFN